MRFRAPYQVDADPSTWYRYNKMVGRSCWQTNTEHLVLNCVRKVSILWL